MLNTKPLFTEKKIEVAFDVTLVLRGIHASIELCSSIAVLFITQASMNTAIQFLAQGELTEDSHDWLANWFIHTAQNFSVSSHWFTFVYLFSHGTINLLLVAGLWKNQRWAYPASFVFFSILIVYQLLRIFQTHSIWLVGLTIFDAGMLWLVWHEYQVKQFSH